MGLCKQQTQKQKRSYHLKSVSPRSRVTSKESDTRPFNSFSQTAASRLPEPGGLPGRPTINDEPTRSRTLKHPSQTADCQSKCCISDAKISVGAFAPDTDPEPKLEFGETTGPNTETGPGPLLDFGTKSSDPRSTLD